MESPTVGGTTPHLHGEVLDAGLPDPVEATLDARRRGRPVHARPSLAVAVPPRVRSGVGLTEAAPPVVGPTVLVAEVMVPLLEVEAGDTCRPSNDATCLEVPLGAGLRLKAEPAAVNACLVLRVATGRARVAAADVPRPQVGGRAGVGGRHVEVEATPVRVGDVGEADASQAPELCLPLLGAVRVAFPARSLWVLEADILQEVGARPPSTTLTFRVDASAVPAARRQVFATR